jgi:hypothetical protein
VPAIKNFGYLWDRDRVFWGRGKANGTLLGYHKDFGKIDFSKQKGVYLLHTRDLKIVYVGQVGSGDQNLIQRLRRHQKSAALWNRWRYFSWFGWRAINQTPKNTYYNRLANYSGGSPVVGGKSEEFLDEIEAVLIQVVEPTLNKQGPRWKSTMHFDQLDDDRLQLSDLPTIAERQNEISETVDKISQTLARIKAKK